MPCQRAEERIARPVGIGDFDEWKSGAAEKIVVRAGKGELTFCGTFGMF